MTSINEELNRKLRRARGGTVVGDAYFTPPGHREIGDALRYVKKQSTYEPCDACSHPERDVIDGLLAAGESRSRITEEFGVGEATLQRHREEHLPALQKARASEGSSVADRLKDEELQSFTRASVRGTEHVEEE